MALFGNAHTVNPQSAQQDYARLLGHGEQVHAAFLLIRDTILFTDRRLILIDKQGITGKKVEYHSVPYRSITHFSVETAGTFDLDAELKKKRGVPLTPDDRERITSCTDLDTLTRWFDRSLTATGAQEVFSEE